MPHRVSFPWGAPPKDDCAGPIGPGLLAEAQTPPSGGGRAGGLRWDGNPSCPQFVEALHPIRGMASFPRLRCKNSENG